MASSHQEPDSRLATKQDQFNRLPDDIVLLIINNLLQAKTLIRLSLVSKRFFSLVFQTDSIFVDLNLLEPNFRKPSFGFLENLFNNVTRTSTPSIPNSNSQNLSAILRGFQQIKNLHVGLCVDPSAEKPLENGTFLRWVAAFGSHFEFCQLLIASSLNQSNPSVSTGIDVMQDLSNESFEHFLSLLSSSLDVASMRHDLIRGHVLERKMLESVVFSDNCIGGKVIMGKEQIARLRSNQGVSAFPIKLRVLARYVPTLHLLELGYTLNKVTFLWFVAVNQNSDKDVEVMDAEGVEVMDAEGVEVMHAEGVEVLDAEDVKLMHAVRVEVMDAEGVEVMDLPVLDHSDFKRWEVFDKAVRLIVDEIKVKMSLLDIPCDILQ